MTSCFSRGLLHRVVRSFSGYDIVYVYYDAVVTNDEWVKPVYLNPCRVVCGESGAYSNLIFYSFGLKIMDLVVVFELYGFLSNDCLLYTSPSPRDLSTSRMPSSA